MIGSALLLGFDARLSEAPEWDAGRRRSFLLRLDVASPRSIDPAVWPSAFAASRLERPAYIGPFADLWDDLGRLRETLGAAQDRAAGFLVAAFRRETAVASQREREALEVQLRGVRPDGTPGDLRAAFCAPSAVEPAWRFLGYDVADLWGLSGLMNCRYQPEREDVAALRRRWSPRLNGLHLFDDLRSAAEFKELSNGRVAEHAPFYVDGIWLVDAAGTGAPDRVLEVRR